MRSVPTIDLSAYRADEFEADHFETLALACKDMGLFLLKGHGLDELISEVFAESKSFFSEEKEYKYRLRRDADNPLGYFDRELTKRKRDQKEVFDFKAGGHESKKASRTTRWPENRKAFRECLTRFFESFTLLSEEVIEMKDEGIREFIRLIASTGILGDRQKDFSDKFIQSNDSEFLDNFMTKFIGSN